MLKNSIEGSDFFHGITRLVSRKEKKLCNDESVFKKIGSNSNVRKILNSHRLSLDNLSPSHLNALNELIKTHISQRSVVNQSIHKLDRILNVIENRRENLQQQLHKIDEDEKILLNEIRRNATNENNQICKKSSEELVFENRDKNKTTLPVVICDEEIKDPEVISSIGKKRTSQTFNFDQDFSSFAMQKVVSQRRNKRFLIYRKDSFEKAFNPSMNVHLGNGDRNKLDKDSLQNDVRNESIEVECEGHYWKPLRLCADEILLSRAKRKLKRTATNDEIRKVLSFQDVNRGSSLPKPKSLPKSELNEVTLCDINRTFTKACIQSEHVKEEKEEVKEAVNDKNIKNQRVKKTKYIEEWLDKNKDEHKNEQKKTYLIISCPQPPIHHPSSIQHTLTHIKYSKSLETKRLKENISDILSEKKSRKVYQKNNKCLTSSNTWKTNCTKLKEKAKSFFRKSHSESKVSLQ